jgi:hypothetical protein
VVPLAGTALDSLDIARGIQSSDNVLPCILALPAVCFNISTQLRLDVDSELIALHIYPVPGKVVFYLMSESEIFNLAET